MIYGIICWPSKSAADAFPNAESEREPEIHSILSDSMILFVECVFCSGTMVNCATSVEPWNAEPAQSVSDLTLSVQGGHLPTEVQLWPFQKKRNVPVPSVVLSRTQLNNV